jgi:hypothetical protein
VTVSAGNPVITGVATSSGDVGICCLTTIREEWRYISGTTNYVLQPIEFNPPSDQDRIYGRGRQLVSPATPSYQRRFGSTPGKARLRVVKGNRRTLNRAVDHGQARRLVGYQNFLAGGVPPIRFYVEMQTAKLVLQTASGRELIYDQLAFGPDVHLKVVSGVKWFKAWKPGPAEYTRLDPTPNGTAMLVTHIPECEGKAVVIGSQEKGADKYSFPVTIRPAEVNEAISKGVTGAKVIRLISSKSTKIPITILISSPTWRVIWQRLCRRLGHVFRQEGPSSDLPFRRGRLSRQCDRTT